MIRLSEYKRIHCIGIGGVGLSAIAEILLSRGYEVSGSDMKPSEITERLHQKGARIYDQHLASNVEGIDLIIYSAAIDEENPEIAKAKELGIPMASRAEVLGLLMDEYNIGIAISGTHGKTSTTSMISQVLEGAALDPTILVGGKLDYIGGNVKIGNSQYFVTEACEYRDSFLSLRPFMEVILNIDSDHLDYFKDMNHIVNSFQRFVEQVKSGGLVVAYDANPFVRKAIESCPNNANVITYGYSTSSNYYIDDITFDDYGMPTYCVMSDGRELAKITLSVPGEHNILNATAAFACCHQLGVEPVVISRLLNEYTGTKRRFDRVGMTHKGALIIDDYAHHPTEIMATLSAAKNFEHRNLICIFQPHTYTRTLALFEEFVDAFSDADQLILADIYAAREKNIYNISSEKLAEAIVEKYPNKQVKYFNSFEHIASAVRDMAQEGDIIITMGAGDVYKIGGILLEKGDN